MTFQSQTTPACQDCFKKLTKACRLALAQIAFLGAERAVLLGFGDAYTALKEALEAQSAHGHASEGV